MPLSTANGTSPIHAETDRFGNRLGNRLDHRSWIIVILHHLIIHLHYSSELRPQLSIDSGGNDFVAAADIAALCIEYFHLNAGTAASETYHLTSAETPLTDHYSVQINKASGAVADSASEGFVTAAL